MKTSGLIMLLLACFLVSGTVVADGITPSNGEMVIISLAPTQTKAAIEEEVAAAMPGEIVTVIAVAPRSTEVVSTRNTVLSADSIRASHHAANPIHGVGGARLLAGAT